MCFYSRKSQQSVKIAGFVFSVKIVPGEKAILALGSTAGGPGDDYFLMAFQRW